MAEGLRQLVAGEPHSQRGGVVNDHSGDEGDDGDGGDDGDDGDEGDDEGRYG